jgi:hypothetical protein
MKIIEVTVAEEISSKQAEITAKVEAYKAAQLYQLQHGGPGPVADIDIMVIVNEHNGEFQVVVKQQEEIIEN